MNLRPVSVVVALAVATAAPAQSPSLAEEYRIDSLRTKALNDSEQARLAASAPIDIVPAPAAPTAAEIALARRVADAMAAWRDRRDECRAGRRSACD